MSASTGQDEVGLWEARDGAKPIEGIVRAGGKLERKPPSRDLDARAFAYRIISVLQPIAGPGLPRKAVDVIGDKHLPEARSRLRIDSIGGRIEDFERRSRKLHFERDFRDLTRPPNGRR
jgi:hypothetical protein